MLRRKVVLMLVMVVAVGGCWLAQALSQQAGGEDDRAAERRRRMEEFRQRRSEQMREQLGANQEEWTKVLQPRIEKVQQLQRQSRGGFRGMRGGRGRRGGRRGGGERPAAGAPQREQSDVEKKTEALRKLLEDKASNANAVKAALDALRKARAKAAADLAAARKELRGVVTVRQEAQLVLLGLLE